MTETRNAQQFLEVAASGVEEARLAHILVETTLAGLREVKSSQVLLEVNRDSQRPARLAHIFLEVLRSVDYNDTAVVSGLEATGEIGTVTIPISPDIIVLVSGIEGTAQLGSVIATPVTMPPIDGLEGTGQLGDVEVCIIQDIWTVVNPDTCSDDWNEVPNA